jgi:hypothetical protein
MIIADSYPFLDIVGTMLVLFFWIMWFWCLIVVLSDLFSRSDIGGWAKAGWVVLTIFLPLLGVLIYLIAYGRGMAERRVKGMEQQQQALDAHIRQVAASGDASGATVGAAGQIAQAKQLLDSGAIDQGEYERLKEKALA